MAFKSLKSWQDCSKERLEAELKFGRELLESAPHISTADEEADFEVECCNWCESLAFAVNFVFDGEPRSFLSVLGHYNSVYGEEVGNFTDWKKPWANSEERLHTLEHFVDILENWVARLYAKFQGESEAMREILAYLYESGGIAEQYSVQVACEFDPQFLGWLLHNLSQDKLVSVSGAAVSLTDLGYAHLESVTDRSFSRSTADEPPTQSTSNNASDFCTWFNSWVGIIGIVVTILGILAGSVLRRVRASILYNKALNLMPVAVSARRGYSSIDLA